MHLRLMTITFGVKTYNFCELLEMKQIKYPYLQLLLLLLIVSSFPFNPIGAQNSEIQNLTNEETALNLTKKQNEKMNFYNNQEQIMYDLNLKYLEEMQSIISKGKSFSTKRKLKKMGKRKDDEVKEILDDIQFRIYEDMKGEIRALLKSHQQTLN